jgi:hypothetical protein
VTRDSNSPARHVIDSLGERHADALTTLELLQGYRPQVEANASALENPRAVLDYLDFFTDLVTRAADECARIAGALQDAPVPAHAEALRQVATICATEQRRCLQFRDKWINKPLPQERMRSLLNEISVTTRDQLTAFSDLQNTAARIDELIPAQPPALEQKRGLDRRQLFTRLFKR